MIPIKENNISLPEIVGKTIKLQISIYVNDHLVDGDFNLKKQVEATPIFFDLRVSVVQFRVNFFSKTWIYVLAVAGVYSD